MRISDWSSDVCSSDLIKHDFGYILPCRVKELFGSFYPYPLYVGNGRVVGSLFKSPFKCSSSGIDQPGQRFDGYFLNIMFFNVILNFLDVIIPKIERTSCREGVWQYL